MKPLALRPQARQDRRNEVRHDRDVAGAQVATKLVSALQKALLQIQHQPGIGSPTRGQALTIAGFRTWLVDGFPLVFWYFERESLVDVARLVGQRQDALGIEIDPTP